jgi:hypothetical protein
VDSRAGTQEHLVTWLYLKDLELQSLNETQRHFREAQKQAALRAAESVRLGMHLPMRWPVWTRAIWLALIILLSALLLPGRDQNRIKVPERTGAVVSLNAGGGAGGPSDTLRDAPRVQTLSPAQLRKFELMATDPNLPAAMKGEALKELNDAIGGLPESELTPDERQVLDLLRKQAAAENFTKPREGSVTVNASETHPNREKTNSSSSEKAANYARFEDAEKAWAVSESRFMDVRERLAKYYK